LRSPNWRPPPGLYSLITVGAGLGIRYEILAPPIGSYWPAAPQSPLSAEAITIKKIDKTIPNAGKDGAFALSGRIPYV
jgi:hypothetical protein